MRTFTDSANRKWQLAVTLGSAMAVKTSLPGVDLLTPEAGDPPLIQRFIADETLLGQTIFELIRSQVDKAGIAEADILDSFDGRTMHDAQTAFFGELADFFQSRGRLDRAAAVNKTVQVLNHVVTAGTARVEAVPMPDLLAMNAGAKSGASPALSGPTLDC